MLSLFPKAHPGTLVYNTNRFSGWTSLDNIWYQIDELGKDLQDICDRHPEGVHLLGYSQGGLVARGILESFDRLNVKNFISLSSPQAGQFGSKFVRTSKHWHKVSFMCFFQLPFYILSSPIWLQKRRITFSTRMLVNTHQWETIGMIHINRPCITTSAHSYHT